MNPHRAMATLAAALLATSPALAQSPSQLPGFQLERLDLNPSAAGSLVVGTGELAPRGQLRVSLLAHHEHLPLTFYRSGSARSAVIENRLTTHVLAAWSATDRLELGFQLPVIVRQKTADLGNVGISAPSSSGLSTPYLHGRLGLLAQRAGNPMDLAVELGTGLPLGSGEALARSNGFRFTPKVMVGRTWGLLRTGAEAGLLLQPTVVLSPEAREVQDEIGNELRFGASVSTTNKGLRGEVAVRGALPLVRSPASLEALAGLRYPMASGLEVFAMGGMGIGTNPGTPQFRALAGISFGGDVRRQSPMALCSQEGTCEAPEKKPAIPAASVVVRDNDMDHDGVTNHFDNCPSRPGPVENQGCPGARQQVVITQKQLVLLDKIYFEFNRAVIQPKSFSLLDQVAAIFQEHPEIELVSIDGHTDSVGSAAYNDKLSRDRADAVRQYLVRQGVSSARLATRGFGFNKPAFSNTTPDGRDANRRVEFNIVSLTSSDATEGVQLSHR